MRRTQKVMKTHKVVKIQKVVKTHKSSEGRIFFPLSFFKEVWHGLAQGLELFFVTWFEASKVARGRAHAKLSVAKVGGADQCNSSEGSQTLLLATAQKRVPPKNRAGKRKYE